MAYDTNSPYARSGAGVRAEPVDAGLRSYMLSVYNYMALALVITGLMAFVVASTPAIYGPIFSSPLKWVVMLAPLGFVLALSFGIQKMSVGTAQIVFWTYAATMGLSLSVIFLAFTAESIARTFFITAAAFGALSLYGYTTKRDLTAMGSFLIMGVFGLIIASVVNIFLGSTALQFAVSVLGVLIFAGLTAYDTQRIKSMYFEVRSDGTAMSKAALMGALALYLDFINLFMFLLQFMGQQRN
ncbi:MAG: Bax inhibitor-1/YccA family protein [Pseudomonadota bacterium]